ncbi:prefoldin subunit 5 [Acetoanaerobium pronyense]|uniref:Prefoldin subunit 5 n=1 Tax=Acetoanaerobium pronyense TaxID=1482736 RepID=A0ABS4KLU5_9FIRM|nr:hypothetical protein [Acetoanaerobium pronyense]MBP2028757.1 prefoldin subunit 5 [Acetoanaerobium pronyense]
MKELVDVLLEIRNQLEELNSKIDGLTSSGTTSLDEVVNAIEDLKNNNGYELGDIKTKLAFIDTAVDSIETSISSIDTAVYSLDLKIDY